MLRASLLERPGRLALEVHDDEIVALQQHLAEMIVTVVARLERRQSGSLVAAIDAPLQQVALRRASSCGICAHDSPAEHPWQRASSASVSSQLCCDAPVHACRSCAVIGSGAKAGSVGREGKRRMQFRGARGRARESARHRHRAHLPAVGPPVRRSSRNRIEIVDRVIPAVALVRHERLQQRQRVGRCRRCRGIRLRRPAARCCGKCAISVSRRPISTSGFTPFCRRR